MTKVILDVGGLSADALADALEAATPAKQRRDRRAARGGRRKAAAAIQNRRRADGEGTPAPTHAQRRRDRRFAVASGKPCSGRIQASAQPLTLAAAERDHVRIAGRARPDGDVQDRGRQGALGAARSTATTYTRRGRQRRHATALPWLLPWLVASAAVVGAEAGRRSADRTRRASPTARRPPATWNVVDRRERRCGRRRVAGVAVSSPIVWGDRVFVSTAVSSDPNAGIRTGLYGDVEPVDRHVRHTRGG